MSKKKVCRSCKMFVEEDECPVCHSAQFAANWKGKMCIINAEHSMIAKKIGIKKDGEYAIKVS